MAATREELRDHLHAVIEAARELPQEDRAYLADTFLDELDKQYRLVPRAAGAQPVARRADPPAYSGSSFTWWPVPIALMFLLPILLVSVVHIHAPVFLLVLIFLALFRFAAGGGRRGGPRQRGPRAGAPTRYYL